MIMNNRILIINHIFWPDKINTARHISELAEELVHRGWDVTALVGNRFYTNHRKKIKPKKGVWKGVKYNRIYIPPFNQKRDIQRLITSIWFIISCFFKLLFIGRFDAIIIGTNPPFVYLLAPFIRIFKSKTKILMWGFDLYPEALIASKGKLTHSFFSFFQFAIGFCYNKLNVIVDIGPCMRDLYRKYNHTAKEETLPPWSFVELDNILEPHNETRKNLFGDANLTLLYSGTIGNAHEFDNFLLLAKELRKRKASVGFCFAGFGNRFKDLKSQVNKEDCNITFGGFVESDLELQQRISAADIMLISLKDKWSGVSVPSKYFTALATGKAILFSGSKKSSLSIWTNKYQVGYQLSKGNIKEVSNLLCKIAQNPIMIANLKKNAFNIYQSNFSKKIICDKWSAILKEIINEA